MQGAPGNPAACLKQAYGMSAGAIYCVEEMTTQLVRQNPRGGGLGRWRLLPAYCLRVGRH